MTLRIFVILGLLVLSIIYTSLSNNITIVEASSQRRELPIYSVTRGHKKMACSVDGAGGTDYNKDILDILDKYDVKSTFFLVGFWAEKHEDLVKEIYEKGHDVGNHSTNHPYMTKLSEEQMVKELKETGDL